jgi:hypothetical protein
MRHDLSQHAQNAPDCSPDSPESRKSRNTCDLPLWDARKWRMPPCSNPLASAGVGFFAAPFRCISRACLRVGNEIREGCRISPGIPRPSAWSYLVRDPHSEEEAARRVEEDDLDDSGPGRPAGPGRATCVSRPGDRAERASDGIRGRPVDPEPGPERRPEGPVDERAGRGRAPERGGASRAFAERIAVRRDSARRGEFRPRADGFDRHHRLPGPRAEVVHGRAAKSSTARSGRDRAW